ncbi:MAG TPA: amidase, partial [Actinomycetota bacterium]|nr:amidase [Actinomycetota bacterium]
MLDELASAVRGRRVSAEELVRTSLERIERLNPTIGAVISVRERSVDEARALDARVLAGEDAGPLAGVPLLVKDMEPVEGVPTTHGSLVYADAPPADADGLIPRRLKAAGAIVVGKTNQPEFAFAGYTDNLLYGPTRNPWNLEASPGGSSGGSGAAMAAGMAPIATATDGGGSIRIPAAFCGLVGLKPQRGRVPMEPHDHWNNLSAAGCVTRRVADTALYLDVVTDGGGDPGGPEPPAQPFAVAAATTPARLRIAISSKPARAIMPPVVTDEVLAGLAETEDLLRSLGHEVQRHEPDFGMTGNNFVARYMG